MNDLISRQAAIDALGKDPKFKVEPFGKSYDEGRSDQWFKDVHTLTTLPSVENKGEWIPVTERLPKPYEHVLRTVKSIGWNGTSYIDIDLGTICPIDTDVIAWQPLPEPYMTEKGGE